MTDQPHSTEPKAQPSASSGRGAGDAQTRPPWLPIRSLAPRHRPRILAHLVGLSERDRYLRFGYPASDAQIKRYVDGLDFAQDEVFGVFNRRLELVALAHLAFARPGQASPAGAEFGGSVLARLRGRGHGAQLFDHAMLHARNRGTDTLYIHALSENTTMLRIARKAGARVVRDGAESDAYLQLPPDTLASQVEQWLGQRAAVIDYRVKQGAMGVDALLDAISEVRSGIAKLGNSGKD